MPTISELESVIEEELKRFAVPTAPKELYEPITYTLQNGGKRMRPLLVLLGCKVFNADISHTIHPALGIELFHNSTLLHDDVMDNAPLRRGQQTVHKKWDGNVAILSGHVMLVQAYREISNTRSDVLVSVLSVFNQATVEVCEGQQLDMNFEKRNDVSIDEYLNMIRLKTAVLLGASLKIGAIIGGAAEEEAEQLYQFGVNTGIAFQLQDDILDVYGNSQKVGKQKGGDIIANKKTFLLLKAMEIATPIQQKELKKWLADNSDDPTKKVNAILHIYEQLNIRNAAEKRMKEYYNRAIKHLDQIEGNAAWISVLRAFTDGLMLREH
ncbi:MAG: polyprenyl synthetase family protein [Flavobacteriales bacterium]|nr:polyprenyl synthetase family protein [Flavobacteriales bacterium]